MSENLDLVHQKCIDSNPEIEVIEVSKGCRVHGGGWLACNCTMRERPVRLADVLLAIGKMGFGKTPSIEFRGNEIEFFHWGRGGYYWNLRKDELSKQSKETINFLAELLK